MFAWFIAIVFAFGGPAMIADGHVGWGLLFTIGGWLAIGVGVLDLLTGGSNRRSRRR